MTSMDMDTKSVYNDDSDGDAAAHGEVTDVDDSVDMGDPEHIRDDLEQLLDQCVQNQMVFSHHKGYQNAPNPILNIPDTGIVGLPFIGRDIEGIKNKCSQVQLGNQNSATNAQDGIWAMNAQLVTLSNPHWSHFMAQVTQDMCEALDIDVTASHPQCELDKLLLSDSTGFRHVSCISGGKSTNAIAAFVVILPSQFAGGAVQLSHAGISHTYDFAATGCYTTNVIAWYTGVACDSKPLSGGAHLALYYNLLHTSESPQPSLPTHATLVSGLRRVFRTWKVSEGQNSNIPSKLLYLLDGTYSSADLVYGVRSLTGVDAAKAAMLRPLVGRRLGLSHIKCFMHKEILSAFGSVMQSIDDDVKFGRDGGAFAIQLTSKAQLVRLVDCEGRHISGCLHFNCNEAMPHDLEHILNAGCTCRSDQEVNESEQHVGCYRTVLVIWTYGGIYCGSSGLDKALDDLKTVAHAQEDANLLDYIFGRVSSTPKEAAASVCAAACEMNNIALWKRTIHACGTENRSLSLLPAGGYLAAVKCFGFELIREELQDVLRHRGDCKNTTRLQLLNDINSWAASTFGEPSGQYRVIRQWINQQVPLALKAIGHLEAGDPAALLLSTVKLAGSPTILNDYLLRQICHNRSDADALRTLAVAVHEDPLLSESEPGTKHKMVSKLLLAAFTSAYDDQVHNIHKGWRRAHDPSQRCFWKEFEIVHSYARLVQDLGCNDLLDQVIDRVSDTSALKPTAARDCARHVMLPLITFLEYRSETFAAAALPSRFEHLQRTAIKLYRDFLKKLPHGPGSRDKGPVAPLIDAALAGGDTKLFLKFVWPYLQSVTSDIQDILEQVAARRHKLANIASNPDGISAQSIIVTLAKRYIRFHLRAYNSDFIECFNLCYKINCLDEVTDDILTELLGTLGDSSIDLVHLLPQLYKWAIHRRKNLDPVLQRIIVASVEKLIEPHQTLDSNLYVALDALWEWICVCDLCTPVQTFLRRINRYEDSTKLDRIGLDSCKHVESHLQSHARKLATWSIIDTSPRSLEITKSEHLGKLLSWREGRQKVQNMLKGLGTDEKVPRRILGADYDRIKNILDGRMDPSTVSRPAVVERSSTVRTLPALEGADSHRPAKRQRIVRSKADSMSGKATVGE